MKRTLRRAKNATATRRTRVSSLRRTKSASDSDERAQPAHRSLKRTKSELSSRRVAAAVRSVPATTAWIPRGHYTLELCERIALLCDDAWVIRDMLELRRALNAHAKAWLPKLDAHLLHARAKLNVDWDGAVDALVSAYTLLEFLALSPDADALGFDKKTLLMRTQTVLEMQASDSSAYGRVEILSRLRRRFVTWMVYQEPR